jgi:predicted dehydrogenase
MIGLGGKGRAHAANLAKLPGVRLVALCDVSAETVARTREQLSDAAAGAYDTADADRLFGDRTIDAVVISTQHDTHAPLAIGAAQAKKHILCEKPLALTIEECRAIEDAVRTSGMQLLMGYNHRHRFFVQMVKQRIPRPKFVVGNFVDLRWPDDYWAVDPIKGGGNVLSQGCHAADLLTYFAAADPLRVFATGGVLSHNPAVTPTTDTVLANVTYANRVLATIVLGDFGPAPYSNGAGSVFHIYSGMLPGLAASVEHDKLTFFYAEGKWAPNFQREEHGLPQVPADRRFDLMGAFALVEEFVACARENRPPHIAADVRQGRIATTLILTAFESIRTGEPQAIAL